MGYKDIIGDLKSNNLCQLYLLYGEEQYLIEKVLHSIKEEIIAGQFEPFNYQVFDGGDLDIKEIINACETLPFMDNKRMIIIRDVDWFSAKGKLIDRDDEKKLFDCFKNLPKTTHLFFIVNKEIDKRRKIVKQIIKHGKTIELARLKGNEIYKWVEKTFKSFGKDIDSKTIAFFLENTGYLENNSPKRLWDLENEIKKIANYVGNKNSINSGDIDLLTAKSVENNIFRMLESIGTNESDKALQIFNEMLMEGEPIARIVYMIIRQFRFLYKVKIMESNGYSPATISSRLNIQPFQTRKYIQQVANFDIKSLRRALDYCLDMDRDIKRGYIDARVGIELLISRFSI